MSFSKGIEIRNLRTADGRPYGTIAFVGARSARPRLRITPSFCYLNDIDAFIVPTTKMAMS